MRSTVGKNSDSVGCINEQRSVPGYAINRTAIVPSAIPWSTIERMKKIFPIVVNPVNRWSVPARRRLMPAVDKGTVNQAQVKLSFLASVDGFL